MTPVLINFKSFELYSVFIFKLFQLVCASNRVCIIFYTSENFIWVPHALGK